MQALWPSAIVKEDVNYGSGLSVPNVPPVLEFEGAMIFVRRGKAGVERFGAIISGRLGTIGFATPYSLSSLARNRTNAPSEANASEATPTAA